MSDDLDLRGIDHRHEPDTQFRAALQRRLAAIVAGTSPGSVTEAGYLAAIDLEPTNANPAPKRNRRRVAQSILATAAAAVVVVIALVATRDDDSAPADQPSPTDDDGIPGFDTVTVPVTSLPQALPTAVAPLVAGTYFVDVNGTPTPRILFTVGAGWHGGNDGVYQKDIGSIAFTRPDRVFADACHWSDGYHPGSVATVDGFVAALSEQGGWAEVTAPWDISVDGYSGKAFQGTAPAELADCSIGENIGPRVPGAGARFFRIWESGGAHEPGVVVTLWVLDLNGTVVVADATLWPSVTTGARALAGPSAAARSEFAAVLDSIRIERG